MITINYITYDSWWDTDITVIPELARIFNVNVFCLDPYKDIKYPEKEVPPGVSLTVHKQKCRDRNPKSMLTALRFFYKCVFSNVDKRSIYFFIIGKNQWLLLMILLFFPKRRTIISSHNYIEHGDRKDVGASVSDSIKKRFYDKFLFFHFFSKSQLELFKKDYPYKNGFATEMPIKDYGTAIVTKRTDTKVRLLFFGLIRDYKRLDWLIKAVKSLDESNLKVVIAGNASAEDKKRYYEMIENDEAFETHFEFIRNEDVPQYFSNSDFLVLPYESATQSGPSLIAINYGVPIIASDIPAFKELIKDGKNGFLFQVDSIDGLKSVLKSVSKMTRLEIDKMKSHQQEFKLDYTKRNNISTNFSGFIHKYMVK